MDEPLALVDITRLRTPHGPRVRLLLTGGQVLLHPAEARAVALLLLEVVDLVVTEDG